MLPKKSKRVVRKVAAKKPPASPLVMDRVRRMAIWLGCVFPVDFPIKVVWSNTISPDRLGECAFRETSPPSFEIRLRQRLNTEVALSTLSHEWAHARTMLGLQDGEDYHSARFWTVLGEIDGAWRGGGQRAAARLSL